MDEADFGNTDDTDPEFLWSRDRSTQIKINGLRGLIELTTDETNPESFLFPIRFVLVINSDTSFRSRDGLNGKG